MELEKLIDWSRVRIPGKEYAVSVSPVLASATNKTLDDLIHVNTRILRTKLEAIGTTVQARLKIRQQNIERIADDREKLTGMVQQISVAANYHLRDHKEKDRLYQRDFELTQERRDQDTQCWRDIVLVLRDFLMFWDEYERAKARGAFLEDV
ncbi:MAG: hypothetical protein PCFJNLEI_01623 [Verrucomicrobiae bacterium]|nr:hypothetical protein [Verrucomicrobiae bacterium]